eukprot:RCo025112
MGDIPGSSPRWGIPRKATTHCTPAPLHFNGGIGRWLSVASGSSEPRSPDKSFSLPPIGDHCQRRHFSPTYGTEMIETIHRKTSPVRTEVPTERFCTGKKFFPERPEPTCQRKSRAHVPGPSTGHLQHPWIRMNPVRDLETGVRAADFRSGETSLDKLMTRKGRTKLSLTCPLPRSGLIEWQPPAYFDLFSSLTKQRDYCWLQKNPKPRGRSLLAPSFGAKQRQLAMLQDARAVRELPKYPKAQTPEKHADKPQPPATAARAFPERTH